MQEIRPNGGRPDKYPTKPPFLNQSKKESIMKNLFTRAKAQAAVLGTTLAMPLLALADDDLSTTAVTEIGKLKPMVVAVGGAFLGVALAFVGYKVIMKVINRGG